MKINNLIYIVLLGIIVSLTSCEDDDSLFSGNENYITSFRLVQQGDSYAGIIKGDSLILSIPENLSLEGVEKPNKFDPFGQTKSAHLIYHTIAPLKVLVLGVNFILPF